MAFRTFDEMMEDSAKIHTFNRERLKRRLIQLEKNKDGLVDEDYKTRMIELIEDLAVLEKYKKLEEEMMDAATKDQLTGLFGSNYIRQRMNSWYKESKDGLAVLMWDIDHFKEVNDRVNHFYGDNALRLIAHEVDARLKQAVSQHKYIHAEMGRYGGEEFVAGLLNFKTNEHHLEEIADYVREGVAGLKLSEEDGIPEDLRHRSITVVGKIYEAADMSVFNLIKDYIDSQLIYAKKANRRNSTIIIPRRYIKEHHKG